MHGGRRDGHALRADIAPVKIEQVGGRGCSMPLQKDVPGVHVPVAKPRCGDTTNQIPGCLESIEPLPRSSSPLSTSIEESVNQVGRIGDELGHQVSPIGEPGRVPCCSHHSGGRNPSIPRDPTGQSLVIRTYPAHASVPIAHETREEAATPSVVPYGPVISGFKRISPR